MTKLEKHLARQFEFDDLLNALEKSKAERAIYCKSDGHDLLIWNYTNKCVYDRLWTPISRIARGLILDMNARKVVATPFPKFFNVGEMGQELPSKPFEVFEKLDGSLIILFYHDGRWKASTRGALGTSQAVWAEKFLVDQDLSALVPGATYLAEAIYPENRIVIRYAESGLVLLSGYDAEGYEFSAEEIYATASTLGWRAAERYAFDSVEEMFQTAEGLPEQEEGYVLRFEDGFRMKLKGAAYCRVHALISRVTPLGIWDAMNAGDDLEEIRQYIPEELWWDFDKIVETLQTALDKRIATIMATHEATKHLTDKEVGLSRDSLPPEVGGMIFIVRKDDTPLMEQPKARHALFRAVRPTENQLAGYKPSFAIARVIGEGG